jgi:hypothetical protein
MLDGLGSTEMLHIFLSIAHAKSNTAPLIRADYSAIARFLRPPARTVNRHPESNPGQCFMSPDNDSG